MKIIKKNYQWKYFSYVFSILAVTSPVVEAQLEEVVVTARKRAETTMEIPESVSAMGDFQLEQSNINNIDDVGLRISNLNLSTRADGNPNVTIRGVGSFGNTQGVGFYVDGVQIFVDASADFGDIERLEVLKGPQGTLYGGSNVGGAVKFETKRPMLNEFNGSAEVAVGDQNMRNAKGHVNLPLGDKTALRIYGYHNEDDGYVEATDAIRVNGRSNITDSYIWPIPLADSSVVPDGGVAVGEKWRHYPNEKKEEGVRTSLYSEIDDTLSIYATLRYNELDAGNNNWRAENPNDLRYSRERDLTFAGRNVRDTLGGSFQIDKDFSNFSVTYLTSFTDAESLRTTDLDVSKEVGFDLVRLETTDVQTHELRFTSTGDGSFEWLAGLYYSTLENDWATYAQFYGPTDVLSGVITASDTLNILDGTLGDPVLPPTFAEESTVRVPFPFENRYRERTNTAAFFTGSYKWEQWELGLGLRVDDWEADTLDRNAGIYATGVPYLKQGDTEILPKVSLSRFFEDGTHVYASYSQGFEPGNFNLYDAAGTPVLNAFDKETVNNYELGFKTRQLDDHLDFNMAFFFIDYTDRQFELQQQIAIGGVVENILNAGDSDQYGLEFDFNWLVADYFTLSGSYGYIEAEFGEGALVNDVTSQPSDVSGKTPPWVSKYAYNLAGQFNFPLANGINLLARMEVSGKGPYYFNQENTAKHPSYEVTNARIGLEAEKWSLAVNVENLFDTGYYTDGSIWPGDAVPGLDYDPVIGTLGQPRLVTLSLKVNF
jgi:iron complex outermembrane receptor protein